MAMISILTPTMGGFSAIQIAELPNYGLTKKYLHKFGYDVSVNTPKLCGLRCVAYIFQLSDI